MARNLTNASYVIYDFPNRATLIGIWESTNNSNNNNKCITMHIIVVDFFSSRVLKPWYNEQVSQTLFVHYIEYYLFHYIKYNMLSKSSKWEMGFVHYITKFTILRFVISRFECTQKNTRKLLCPNCIGICKFINKGKRFQNTRNLL